MIRPLSLVLAGLALVGCPGLTRIAAADADEEAAGERYDLVFLGGKQPVLLRLHVRIGDRPLHAAWLESVGKLHAYLDSDGNGTLTRAEAERADWPRLARALAGPAPTRTLSLEALDSEPADGIVTVEELAARMYEIRGPLAVVVRPIAPSEQDMTFARIDTDGDGTLGPDERARAAMVLRRYDQNDDESVSSAELATFRNPVFGFQGGPQEGRRGPEDVVLLLDPLRSRIAMVNALVNRLDTGGPGGSKTKDHRLDRAEFGLAGAFDFDQDGDGTLDGDELLHFLDRGEHALRMIVRLGPRPLKQGVVDFVDRQLVARGKPGLGSSRTPYSVELLDPPPPADAGRAIARVRRTDDTLVTLELEEAWVDVRTEDTAPEWERTRLIFASLFSRLDVDGDQALSLAEVAGRDPFQSFFPLMDRDRDGRVIRPELDRALALLLDLSRGRVMLEVSDRGVLVFDALDSSGDRRLGPRELRVLGERLAAFDRDGDGRVAASEIPHHFGFSFSQAPVLPGISMAANKIAQPLSESRRSADGPPWFRTMDRNRDGDLSPREFLGPRAVFQQLDADGDGLIDAREAGAAWVAAP
jgi:Ca2+-binding EF-hand superfamily protein